MFVFLTEHVLRTGNAAGCELVWNFEWLDAEQPVFQGLRGTVAWGGRKKRDQLGGGKENKQTGCCPQMTWAGLPSEMDAPLQALAPTCTRTPHPLEIGLCRLFTMGTS